MPCSGLLALLSAPSILVHSMKRLINREHLKGLKKGGEMCEAEGACSKPDHLNSIPRTLMVERESSFTVWVSACYMHVVGIAFPKRTCGKDLNKKPTYSVVVILNSIFRSHKVDLPRKVCHQLCPLQALGQAAPPHLNQYPLNSDAANLNSLL